MTKNLKIVLFVFVGLFVLYTVLGFLVVPWAITNKLPPMSLQNKSILIDLSLASFSTSRTDVRVTGQVISMTSAKADSGRWVKKILPKDATSHITRLDGQIRKYHRSNTLPWSDKGARIGILSTASPELDGTKNDSNTSIP